MEGDLTESLVHHVNKNKMVPVLNELKSGKAHGPTYVSLEFIAASGEVGIQVKVVYARVLG